MSSSCPTVYGPSPPQDKAYNNFRTLDNLVTKNLVACSMNGKSLVVDNLVVNNNINLPSTTYGSYNPNVVSSTGVTITSGPVANFFQTGNVVQVTGSMGINVVGGALTVNITLPILAVGTSDGFPQGLCNYLQDPPALNSGSGIVYPFLGLSQTAELSFTAPGVPGKILFTFSYIGA